MKCKIRLCLGVLAMGLMVTMTTQAETIRFLDPCGKEARSWDYGDRITVEITDITNNTYAEIYLGSKYAGGPTQLLKRLTNLAPGRTITTTVTIPRTVNMASFSVSAKLSAAARSWSVVDSIWRQERSGEAFVVCGADGESGSDPSNPDKSGPQSAVDVVPDGRADTQTDSGGSGASSSSAVSSSSGGATAGGQSAVAGKPTAPAASAPEPNGEFKVYRWWSGATSDTHASIVDFDGQGNAYIPGRSTGFCDIGVQDDRAAPYALEARPPLGIVVRKKFSYSEPVYAGEVKYPNGSVNRFLTRDPAQIKMKCGVEKRRPLNDGKPIFYTYNTKGSRLPLYTCFDTAQSNTFPTTDPGCEGRGSQARVEFLGYIKAL